MIYPLRDLDNLTHFAASFDASLYQYDEQDTNPVRRARSLFRQPATCLDTVGEKFRVFVLLCARGRTQQRRGQQWRGSNELKEWVLGANSCDLRLYIIPFDHEQNDIERKWDDEARGGKSIWEEAVDLLLEAQLLRIA